MMAAEEADAIVFLVDGKAGLAPDDTEVARILKRTGTPVFLVVNKVDNPGSLEETHEFWSLGLDTPWPVSATHGNGTGDLLDEMVRVLPESDPEVEEGTIDVAIIGRPNAGKSSLLNQLAGKERSIVSDVAGTTRDAIDLTVVRDETTYRLIDTAGIRRKSLIDEDVEYYGFVRAMRAIDRAHVALLVLDSTIGGMPSRMRSTRTTSRPGWRIGWASWDTRRFCEPARSRVGAYTRSGASSTGSTRTTRRRYRQASSTSCSPRCVTSGTRVTREASRSGSTT